MESVNILQYVYSSARLKFVTLVSYVSSIVANQSTQCSKSNSCPGLSAVCLRIQLPNYPQTTHCQQLCNIHHSLSHQQYWWTATSHFLCFMVLNPNQRRLEQDPGLLGPICVQVLLKWNYFWMRRIDAKYSGMIPDYMFEDSMEALDQIKIFLKVAVFIYVQVWKALYNWMRVNPIPTWILSTMIH